MPLDWTDEALAQGLLCYRSEQYFEAHEHWELVWLRTPEPEKSFLQALIQVTAAFHHLQQGNRAGAASLLRRALPRLQSKPCDCGGIAIDSLCTEIADWLWALQGNQGQPASAATITPLPADLASSQ